MLKNLLTLTILVLISTHLLNSQAPKGKLAEGDIDFDFGEFDKSDTLTFGYGLSKGDTLIYRVEGFDSISINYEEPLYRKRYERIRIVCDSVSSDGKMHLTHTLLDYMAKESKGSIKDLERNTTTWQGRSAGYAIDSVGKRSDYKYDDSLRFSMSPGGAFQPFIIIPIGRPVAYIGETWLERDLIQLPENGIPNSIVRQSSLFKVRPKLDTLGYDCKRLEYIRTGQGSVRFLDGERKPMRVTNVINSFGLLDLHSQWNIPVHLFMTMEQKLTIHNGDNDDKTLPGYHYITQYFTLQDYIKAKN